MNTFIKRIYNGIASRLKVAGCAVKYLACLIIPKIDRTETWVICERGTDARDNGYAFYRYLVKKHPELRVHYLITPASADYSKVAEHAVAYGSLKNYRVVAKASKIISTHCYTALPVKSEKLWQKLGLEERFIFLQHGITIEKMTYLFGDRTGMRLFCCAAVPEYNYVKQVFQHPNGVVKCTGLARYDNLLPFHTKKQILIMPTWRRYLLDEQAFLNSDYHRCWNAVLNDDELIRLLEASDLQLIFYPHYELQAYLHHFSSKSDRVIFADFEHYDVQQLLKESMLLITDYSSVQFDFAYMEKPCLFYQFDLAYYHCKHYKEGYFSYERDGFGPVVTSHEELIRTIRSIAEQDYRMDPQYRSRISAFYAHRDDQNCERIYQAIRSKKTSF